MKRILVNGWSALLLLFFVASCGKEKSIEEASGQYFLKCKIGSVDKTFNVSAAAVRQDLGGGLINYSVFGKATADASNYESLGFTIQLAIPFTTGTYKEGDPTTDYSLAGIYNPNTTDQNKIYATSGFEETNPFQITFTEITATTLSGTFQGKLKPLNSTDPNADSVVITNGQFKVKIQ
jgi:hypothetical protein